MHDLELPPSQPGDSERALAEILHALCESLLDGLASEALHLLRQQCMATSHPTAAEQRMLKMIEARLARPHGSRKSALSK